VTTLWRPTLQARLLSSHEDLPQRAPTEYQKQKLAKVLGCGEEAVSLSAADTGLDMLLIEKQWHPQEISKPV
jgi:hypothetical protein